MTFSDLTTSLVVGLALLGPGGASAGTDVGGTPPAEASPSAPAAADARVAPTRAPCGCDLSAVHVAPTTGTGGPTTPASATAEATTAAAAAGSAPAPAVGAADGVPAPALAPDGAAPRARDPEDALLQRLEPKGRFLGTVESDETDDYGRRYGVRQARLGLAYREGPIRAEVEADLAETQVLNDAWLEYRAGDWGRGRLGRFKAPFSEFLLSSSWERPVLRRNGLPRAVRDLGFGGRDIGAMASYRAKSLGRLELEAGLFEGSAIGAAAAAEDGFARLTAAPWKPLRFGASVGRRAVFDGGAGDAFGLDARLELAGITVRIEGLRAENATTGTRAAGAIGHVAYRFPASDRTWLEPAVEAELARADDLDARTTVAATLGAGWGERFLVRGGVEHGPADPLGPASTAILLQAGVQL